MFIFVIIIINSTQLANPILTLFNLNRMIKTLFLALIVVVLSSFGVKSPTFSLSDSSVQIGAVYTLKKKFNKYSNNISDGLKEELDAVSKFLSKNSNLKVEVSVHSNEENSDITTAERAREIENYLKRQGVKGSKIVTIGYGDKRPVITQRELFKFKTLEGKLKAKQQNSRIEMKILDIK
ncbi:MAG: hypothetical protein ACI85I_002437 [Arenicella sp.]|jgi:hypothetical protein